MDRHWKIRLGPTAGMIACLCLALGGCDNTKVQKPASDSTPPVLVWNVFNHDTNAQADHPGSPTLNVKHGERYRVILKANDPQGVQSIQLNPAIGSGEIAWTCLDPPGPPNLGQNKSGPFGPQTQNLAPDSNGMVLTGIFLIQELDFAMPCQPGWSFSGGSAQLTGKASNYFGGVKTEVLTFTVAP